MNIDQHNYEEFFLLYLDGELTPAENRAVEAFIVMHPHLAAELDMLKQTLLLAGETVVFSDKATLYKPVPATEDHYEEQLLDYIDDELSASAKEAIEKLVSENAAAHSSLSLLQQTKLNAAETVVFPYKDSLYRSIGRKRPVIYLRWQRVAVAAVVIGFGLILWFIPGSDRRSKVTETALINTYHPATDKIQKGPVTASALNEPPATSHHATKSIVPSMISRRTVISVQTDQDKKIPAPAFEPRELAKAETEAVRTGNETTTPVQITARLPLNPAVVAKEEAVAVNNAALPTYKELETDEDNKGLLLGSVEINKNKLRGFFRKASSIFKSKAVREEEDARSLR
jgi:hypothetical protein